MMTALTHVRRITWEFELRYWGTNTGLNVNVQALTSRIEDTGFQNCGRRYDFSNIYT